MKKLLLLFTFSFFLFTSSHAQQYGWVDMSSNIPDSNLVLKDVFFINENEGWITSSGANKIYHTTDGGLTFETQTTVQPNDAICMLNENKGFAAGQSGVVHHTINGGTNWNMINTFLPDHIRGMSFPPESDTGFICGESGWVGKVNSTEIFDMEKLVNSSLYAISFPVNGEGWLCGGSIIRHYVSGEWVADQNYPYGGYNAIHFIDNSHGWAAGDDGIITYTTDGINWVTQLPAGSGPTLYDIFFLDELNGWTVGSGGQISYTVDGGNSWNKLDIASYSVTLTSVIFITPNQGFVVGSQSTFLKYTEISGIGDELHNKFDFEIYPNPAVSVVSCQLSVVSSESAVVELYDLNGKKLLEKQILTGNETVEIDVSSLQSGVYLCRLILENKSLTKKLIIK